MKKVLCFAIALVLILSLCACSTQNTNTAKVQSVTDPETTEGIVYTNYEDSLRGICEYMAALGYVYDLPEATGDEMTDPLPMRAEFVGADEGYKFTCKYDGANINVEIYSFTDTNNAYYKQGVETGEITLSEEIDNGTFGVTFSGNGKYMMVYDDAEDRTERKEAAVKAFEAFYA